jgi:hypothetical protein
VGQALLLFLCKLIAALFLSALGLTTLIEQLGGDGEHKFLTGRTFS